MVWKEKLSYSVSLFFCLTLRLARWFSVLHSCVTALYCLVLPRTTEKGWEESQLFIS